MQTIATSPTSRRGVLIENLTAVSPLSVAKTIHLPDISDMVKEIDRQIMDQDAIIAQATYRRNVLLDLQQYSDQPYHKKNIELLGHEEVFLMYSPTMAGEDPPEILLREPTPKSPTLLILYGGPDEKSKIIKRITADQERDVRVVSTCEDLDQMASFGQAQDLKLIVYNAKNCSDMVQWINAATTNSIPVNFMGVGLTDLRVKRSTQEHVKKFTPSLLSTLGSSTHASSTPGSCNFLRSDIETMIAGVIDKAKEKATLSNTCVTRGMWVRLSNQGLDTMMKHIDACKSGTIYLEVDGYDPYACFHCVEFETQSSDMETD